MAPWKVSLAAALVAFFAGSAARADEAREARLERELQEMRRRLDAIEAERARPAGGTRTAAPGGSDALEVTPTWEREELSTPRPLRGVYDKPFLARVWRRVSVGGYTEMEYHAFHDEPLGVPRGFRAHRTNLFAYSEVSDRVRFGSEIEFENEEPGEDLEVAVEMAFVDWVIFNELVVRGGVILAPLGRINVNHDGPVRELADRPLVSTFVIPSTLSETGIGLTGTIRLGSALTLLYEAYATNGFNLLDADGKLPVAATEREQLLRAGKPSTAGDANANIATMGRLAATALDAITVGGSWHVGDYDAENDNTLAILAADAALSFAPFALEGEVAWAGFERNGFARAAGIPDVYWGYYIQASVGGMPELFRRVPHVFDDAGASFTLVLRYDRVDLDGDIGEAIEPGIAFRPFPDTVFKLSWRFSLESLGVRGVPGREGMSDEGLVFSLASYF